MSNATRWYTTREAVKTAVGISGPDLNAQVDDCIQAASKDVEELLNRRFIPQTAIKYFRWPQKLGSAVILRFPDEDLIAVTLLQSQAQDTTPTTIADTDYFIEPVNEGPPYTRIEIDLSSSSAFAAGDTQQRSIAVTGRWGFAEDTIAAGALAEADDGAETELNVSDSSLIGVGDTILATSEALFVSEKVLLDTVANTAGALTVNKAETTVPVDDGTKVKAGEVITIDSERMLVESISVNNLTVRRAYDGSVLATHANPSDVYAPRTLTVVRAVNGTTAAAHADALALTKYAPPGDIVKYVKATAIANHQQDRSGWTGQIGGDTGGGAGGGGVETKMFNIWAMRQALIEKYDKVQF